MHLKDHQLTLSLYHKVYGVPHCIELLFPTLFFSKVVITTYATILSWYPNSRVHSSNPLTSLLVICWKSLVFVRSILMFKHDISLQHYNTLMSSQLIHAGMMTPQHTCPP